MVQEKKTVKRGRYGDGSLFKDSRGYWTATMEVPTLDGTRKRKVKRSRERSVAAAALRDWRNQQHAHGLAPGTSPTVESWFNTWMTVHVTPTLRPRTAESYASIVRTYIIPALGASTKLDKITPAHVRNIGTYVQQQGLSSTTARNAYRTAAKGLEIAMREGHIYSNPARRVEPPRAQVANLDVLNLEESITLLEAASTHPDGARIATSILTGARRGEVIGLERDRVGEELDLSWQLQRLKRAHGCDGKCGKTRPASCPDSVLKVPADFEYRHLHGALYLTRPKSKAGWRIIPLVEPLRSILHRYIAATPNNPHNLVFARADGSPITPDQATGEWLDLMRELYGDDRFVRLHDLRHAAVDLLYLAEVPEDMIQEIVGHSTRAMSRQYKTRGSQVRLRAAMQRMAGLVEAGKAHTPEIGAPSHQVLE